MDGKFVVIDFEYEILDAKRIKPIACVLYDTETDVYNKFWLKNPDHMEYFKEHVDAYLSDVPFVSFSVGAEWRSFYEILRPYAWQIPEHWIDVRILCMEVYHSCGAFALWKHNQAKIDKANGVSRSSYQSLEAFCLYFDIPVAHKEEGLARRIGTGQYEDSEKDKILEYCRQDVEVTYKLLCSLMEKYHLLNNRTVEDFKSLTNFSIQMERISLRGIPVDLQAVNTISTVRETAVNELKSKHEYYIHEKDKYTLNNKLFSQGIHELGITDWPRTESGQAYKKDADTLRGYKQYPVMDSLRKIINLEKDLRAFSTSNVEKSFYKSLHIDSEGNASQHPYYGCYGSFSGRNAASASTFLLLQPKWMRNLIKIPEGKVLIIADFKAQEVWIAGVLSNDDQLLKDYFSDDIYVEFGKKCGLIREEYDKNNSKHANLRKISKKVFLGKLYGMGSYTMSTELNIPEQEAEQYCKSWDRIYWRYVTWQKNKISEHAVRGYTLNRNYKVYDANDECGRFRTLTYKNSNIQGAAAYILRETISVCEKKALYAIWTLHDEVAFLCADSEMEIVNTTNQIQIAMDIGCFKLAGCRERYCNVEFDIVRPGEPVSEQADYDFYSKLLNMKPDNQENDNA